MTLPKAGSRCNIEHVHNHKVGCCYCCIIGYAPFCPSWHSRSSSGTRMQIQTGTWLEGCMQCSSVPTQRDKKIGEGYALAQPIRIKKTNIITITIRDSISGKGWGKKRKITGKEGNKKNDIRKISVRWFCSGNHLSVCYMQFVKNAIIHFLSRHFFLIQQKRISRRIDFKVDQKESNRKKRREGERKKEILLILGPKRLLSQAKEID